MNTAVPLASPLLLFAACVLGALGIAMALPKRGLSPQLLGALVAALGLGGIFIALGIRSPGALPNFNFYLFSLIALGAALRVISHPRPVYAALYFVLTILASAGLYVLLSAEFMAFALVIVYAGAILITYLFVIMLATESPTADQVEALAEYDRYSREPFMAAVTGFILVAGLTTLLGVGTGRLAPATQYAGAERLAWVPGKVERVLRENDLLDASERLARDAETGRYLIRIENGELVGFTKEFGQGVRQEVVRGGAEWPDDLRVTNVEGVGFTLLADHPGGIEVAGVVLLMAMLGAVVLARKKVDLDEQAKLAAQQRALIDESAERALREVAKVSPDATGGGVPASAAGGLSSPGMGGNGHGAAIRGPGPHGVMGGAR